MDLNVPVPAEVAKHGVKVAFRNGVPTLHCGEHPFWGPMYLFDPYEHRPWEDSVRCMYEDGVRIFSMLTSLGLVWDREGAPYDFTLPDELFDRILKMAPDALFMPLVYVHTPNWWDERYPEELLKFKGASLRLDHWENEKQPRWKYEAKMYHSTRNASVASKRWLQDSGQALAAWVRHIEQKYPGHFLGYQPAYGACGEWGTYGSYLNGVFGDYDFSAPMDARFRDFLRQRYGTTEALRKAWHNQAVDFDNALLPDKRMKMRTDVGSLKIPSKNRQYIDWLDAYSLSTVEAMAHFCRIAKENAPGPRTTAVFAGYQAQTGSSVYLAHFGNTVMELALESPHIDILSTPNCYVNRVKGVFSQASVATISKRKLFLAQCDVQPPQWVGMQTDRLAKDAQEWERWFRRDTFYNVVQGSGHLIWYDFGNGWYRGQGMRAAIKTICKSFRRRFPVGQPAYAEVALVLDETSTRMVEGCAGYYRQFRQLINQDLALAGAPFDVIHTSDVLAGQHAYKLYIFRDQFYADSGRRTEIRAVLERQKASAVWCFAAGAIADDRVDASLAESLTGIRMAMLDQAVPQALTLLPCAGDPLFQGMDLPRALQEVEDLNTVYGPVLYADDPAASVLGRIESLELPGMAIKRLNGRFDLWSVSPQFPPDVARRIIEAAGARLYTDKAGAAMVFGAGDLLAVCPEEQGPLALILPPQYRSAEDLGSGTLREVRAGTLALNFADAIPLLLRLQ